MDDRNQQIETLIKLVELNNDPTWLDHFLSLRDGGYLPGGGAGSLNDWGPYYSDPIASVWYSNLYRILRHLFDNDLETDKASSYKPIRFRNNIRILRCLNCGNSYQHPSSFEDHIGLDFYAAYLWRFAADQRLINIVDPNESFENESVVEYRNRLIGEYKANNIRVYDFVAAKYICIHCGGADCGSEHDLYKISRDEDIQFSLLKRNADYTDFEVEG